MVIIEFPTIPYTPPSLILSARIKPGSLYKSGQDIHHCKDLTMANTQDLRVEKLFSVKDYVCVITGGGSGIGLMSAQALAANGMSFLSRNASVY